MNSFRQQCITYLLMRGWVEEYDGWEWYHPGKQVLCVTMGRALDVQLEWDDAGCN